MMSIILNSPFELERHEDNCEKKFYRLILIFFYKVAFGLAPLFLASSEFFKVNFDASCDWAWVSLMYSEKMRACFGLFSLSHAFFHKVPEAARTLDIHPSLYKTFCILLKRSRILLTWHNFRADSSEILLDFPNFCQVRLANVLTVLTLRFKDTFVLQVLEDFFIFFETYSHMW